MISNNSKAWEDIYNPIFKKADKFCKSINAFEDVWYWYVAEETANKICNEKLIVDKKCIAKVFEWKDLGICDYDYDVWSDFENYIEEIE